MILNGAELIELSGEAELMGRSAWRRAAAAARKARRISHRFDPNMIALRAAKRAAQTAEKAALSGDEFGEAELMGRSFFRRRAAAAARVARKTTRAAAPLVRKLSHTALNIGAKIPLTSGFVSAGRSGLALFQTAPGGAVASPASSAAELVAPGATPGADVAAAAAGMSTGKKLAIGGGVVAVAAVAFFALRKK